MKAKQAGKGSWSKQSSPFIKKSSVVDKDFLVNMGKILCNE